MRMHRHHLLEIILLPNDDGTVRKILNSRKRLIELGIYDDWKLTITIPAGEHSRMHSHNRPDGYWYKVSQSMSAALMGKKNPMYGKMHSEETKSKISAAKKGIEFTSEHRANLSAASKGRSPWNKGKKLSEEHRAKLSAVQKGKKFTAEHCAALSVARKGKKCSAAARAKMSAAKKGNTAVKGLHWYNNGITSIRAKECQPGFTRGRIYKRKKSS